MDQGLFSLHNLRRYPFIASYRYHFALLSSHFLLQKHQTRSLCTTCTLFSFSTCASSPCNNIHEAGTILGYSLQPLPLVIRRGFYILGASERHPLSTFCKYFGIGYRHREGKCWIAWEGLGNIEWLDCSGFWRKGKTDQVWSRRGSGNHSKSMFLEDLSVGTSESIGEDLREKDKSKQTQIAIFSRLCFVSFAAQVKDILSKSLDLN